MTARVNARARTNGQGSFWLAQTEQRAPRAALAGNLTADVVLVGAGYTNLWTAYYLKKAKPELDIVILEQTIAGYGASGRNGGWISYGLPGQHRRYAKSHGTDSVLQFQREIFDTIQEIVDVAAAEGIDADITKDGEIAIATNRAQLGRLREELKGAATWGFGSDDLVYVEQSELGDYANLEGALGGLWSPHCARVQPAKLARGLADVVEALGVRIFEGTTVTEITPNRAVTADGHVASAQFIVRGTEGFTPSIRGQKRTWLPKLSSMLVTEPLSPEVMARIGWSSDVMVRDGSHFFSYIHKTADNRIALGGPGVPYLFGSRTDDDGHTFASSERALRAALLRVFPVLRETPIDHTWTGVLGIPRDWSATVSVDHETGLCVAGGYVGDGVSSSNLAARTLRDLILKEDSDITRLPWVGKQIRPWEPEPLRWVALRGMYQVYSMADRLEARSNSSRTSILATAANVISGRH
jgi:glycine/D-amino acid oxidase-like deaminating enzyme